MNKKGPNWVDPVEYKKAHGISKTRARQISRLGVGEEEGLRILRKKTKERHAEEKKIKRKKRDAARAGRIGKVRTPKVQKKGKKKEDTRK